MFSVWGYHEQCFCHRSCACLLVYMWNSCGCVPEILTGSYGTQMFNCIQYDSLSEVHMKLQWPLGPGENVDKMYWEDCHGGSVVEIEHLLCARGKAPIEWVGGALRGETGKETPPVTMGISFQGVSHPGWGRGGLGKPKRADKGFSPSWQYLHLGLGSCVSLIYPEGKGLSGTEFHLPILPQWSLAISFISLCICTLLKFSQLERGTIISTDEVWRRKSFPKLHHLGQMLEQIISPS